MTSKGATVDVGAWLQGLGLGQYEAAFRENEIDDTVLPNLTAEDLKDLGVGIVGHRRKLLDAIAALHATENEKAAPPTSSRTRPGSHQMGNSELAYQMKRHPSREITPPNKRSECPKQPANTAWCGRRSRRSRAAKASASVPQLAEAVFL
jgi:hypothetical protein